MNVWQFQHLISRRLFRWGLFSVIAGLLMRFGGKFWKNMGNQFIAWGAIDALIALAGDITSRDRVDHLANPGKAEVKSQEAANLTRVLWINAALDVLYVLGGWLWMRRDRGDGSARGNGFGVILQGLFLLIFDAFHASKMPTNHDEN